MSTAARGARAGWTWISCALLAGIVVVPSTSSAGAWTLAPREVYAELFGQHFRNDSDFDATGDRATKPNGGRFTEWRGELKFEAGIPSPRVPAWLEDLNILFAFPVETAEFEDNVRLRTTGVEEIRTGLKYRLTPRTVPLVASAQLVAKVPACDTSAQPPLADCQFDFEPRLLVSWAFDEATWGKRKDAERGLFEAYVNLEVGYRFRAGKPADEIPYFFEIAVSPYAFHGEARRLRLWIKGALDGADSRPTGGGEEEDYHKWTVALGLTLRPPLKREAAIPDRETGIELGYGEVFAGRNTGAGQIVFFKVFHRF